EALWRFSLAFYARPGVAKALLALQDRAAPDRAAVTVNLILFGLWLGASQGRQLAEGELAPVATAIAPLAGAAVVPLRRLRRQLTPATAREGRPPGAASDPELQALRRRVAGLEIEAERRVQYRLAARAAGASDAQPAQPQGDRLAIAQANLAIILGGEAGSPEAAVLRGALGTLTRRTGPGT
ncbi:MAG TPA: TIGR02444 family protein, partial [Stellaceae bacterium]|nr:TIGR02444 family protein [Stellaceae bacterium]